MAQPLPFSIQPSNSVETVTPDTARAWLATNTHNRHIRRSVVAIYARDMAEGRWVFTGEPIKFATDGTLLDGQHRLHAVVASEATVAMLVVRGLSLHVQDAMDTGARRTTADALSLSGERNAVVMASVSKLILTDGDRLGDRRVSTGEVSALIDSDDSIRRICVDVLPALRLTVATPAVVGYAYWRLNKIDPDKTAQFFDQLASLVGLPHGSPILALYHRLGNHAKSSRSRAYRREALAYIFMAWNAWARGESRSIIKLAYSEGRLAVPNPIKPRR